jgi:hypothetical protein
MPLQRPHHLNREFPFLVENFRHTAPPSKNLSEVRWLEIELFHAKLYGFNRIGRVDLIVLLLISLHQGDQYVQAVSRELRIFVLPPRPERSTAHAGVGIRLKSPGRRRLSRDLCAPLFRQRSNLFQTCRMFRWLSNRRKPRKGRTCCDLGFRLMAHRRSHTPRPRQFQRIGCSFCRTLLWPP